MATKLEDLLFSMEERFWTEDADFYRRYLAPAAIMVFPEPAGVMVRDEIASSIERDTPWSRVSLEEHRLLELDERAAVITYKATATPRNTGKPYIVRASSAYIRDGETWKLAFHQQTPA